MNAQVNSGAAPGQLARNKLGVGHIVFLVMAAVAPVTAVILVGGMAIALANGAGMVVSLIVLSVILLLFAVGYAQMSKTLISAGGFYAFVVKGLGKMAGLVTGFIATVAYNFFIGSAIGGVGFMSAAVIGSWGFNLDWWVWGIGCIAIAFAMARSGVHFSAKVLGVALVLELLILVVFDIAVLVNTGFSFEVFSPSIVFTDGMGAGLLLAATFFLGFEATALFGEEAKDPKKTIPRATIVAISFIGLVYFLSIWAVVSATGVAQAQDVALEHLEAGDLIFSLSQRYLGDVLTTTMGVLLLVSLFAAVLAFHNAAARYLFSLGRARVLPQVLAKTNKNGAPQGALLVNALFGALVAAVFAALGLDPITTLVPAFLGFATLGVLVLQMLAALAVVVHFRRERDSRWWSTFIAPGIGFLGLLGIVIMAITNFSLVAGSDAVAIQFLPLLLLVASAAAVLYGFYLKAKKPAIYEQLSTDIEKFDVALTADNADTEKAPVAEVSRP